MKKTAVILSLLFVTLACHLYAEMFPSDDFRVTTQERQRVDAKLNAIISEIDGIHFSNNSGAIVLINNETVEVLKNYSSKRTIRKAVKIVSEKGKELVTPQIYYDDSKQKVNIHFARVVQPLGSVKYFTSNVQETGAYPFGNIYTSHKIKALIPPDLRIGSVVDIEYSIIDERPEMPGQFWCQWLPQGLLPTISTSFSLIAPAEINFNIGTKGNLDIEYSKGKAGFNAYVCEMSQIKPVQIEPAMPFLREEWGWVGIGTIASWDSLVVWYDSLFNLNPDTLGELESFAKQLCENVTSRDERIKSVYLWVQNNIRYVSLSLGTGGYIPRPATVTYESRYGDCKDKSLLTISLLKSLGIEAYPVLVRPNYLGPVEIAIPSLTEFNHMIVAVENGDSYLWLDPTLQSIKVNELPQQESGIEVLLMRDNRAYFVSTPKINVTKTGSERNGQILFNDDKWQYNVVSKPYGVNAFYWRASFQNLNQYERTQNIHKEIQQMSPVAVLDSFHIFGVDSLVEQMSVEYYISTPFGDKKRVELNPTLFETGLVNDYLDLFSLPKREHSIMATVTGSYSTSYKILIPRNYHMELLPDSFYLSTKYSIAKTKWKKVGDTLYYNSLIKISPENVAAEDYISQQQFWRNVANNYLSLQRVILKPRKSNK